MEGDPTARTTSPKNLVTSLTDLAKNAETSIEVAGELISREKSVIRTNLPCELAAMAHDSLARRGSNHVEHGPISFSSSFDVSLLNYREERSAETEGTPRFRCDHEFLWKFLMAPRVSVLVI